ncbi:MAG: carbohydrate ABC transporter permease [Clostridiales bacterium]|nr:carbohydrate ABC transporter permease [Clostridiales bacterium]
MKRKLTTGDIIFEVCLGIFLVLFVFVTIYPVLNTLAVSFNDGFDSIVNRIHFIPNEFTLDNYKTVLAKESLRTGLVITIARTVIGTLLSLLLNALLAFVVSRKRFLFKKSVSLFWVITMYVNGGLIPVYLVFKQLGLLNSFWVYVIPGAVSAFNMLVMRNFMNDIPDSLEESAEIDGAGYFTIFTRIISPLCKPVYATIALFVAVYQWNAWFDTMLYNKMRDDLTVLQYELMKMLQSALNQSQNVDNVKNGGVNITPQSLRAAATIATMLPIICLYPFLQRYFVTGLTIGGVKE